MIPPGPDERRSNPRQGIAAVLSEQALSERTPTPPSGTGR
jgi:hypothetical protein